MKTFRKPTFETICENCRGSHRNRCSPEEQRLEPALPAKHPLQDAWGRDAKGQRREIIEAELHEISVGVTFPAYEEATATVRAEDKTKTNETEKPKQNGKKIMNKLARAKMLAARPREIGFENHKTPEEAEEFADIRGEMQTLEGDDDTGKVRKYLGATDETETESRAASTWIETAVAESKKQVKRTVETVDGRRLRSFAPGERLAEQREFRSGLPDGIRPEELCIGRLIRGMATGDWHGAEAERRTLSSGTGSLVGYHIPAPISAGVLDDARNATRVVQAGARTIPMDSPTLKLARLDGDPTAGWRAESAALTGSDITLGQVTLTAKSVAALCKIPLELLEDGQNIGQVVEEAIGAALAQAIDLAALFGTAQNNQPRGIVNVVGINTTALDGIIGSYGPFIGAASSILAANGPVEGLAAIYAPRTWAQVQGFLDGEQNPLTVPPCVTKMAHLITNQVPITLGEGEDESNLIVGDFSQMLLGVRRNITVEVFQAGNDSSTDAIVNMQVFVRAYARMDVAVVRPAFFTVVTGLLPTA